MWQCYTLLVTKIFYFKQNPHLICGNNQHDFITFPFLLGLSISS